MGTEGGNGKMLFPCGLQVKQVSSTFADVRSQAASIKKKTYLMFAMRVARMANHSMSNWKNSSYKLLVRRVLSSLIQLKRRSIGI